MMQMSGAMGHIKLAMETDVFSLDSSLSLAGVQPFDKGTKVAVALQSGMVLIYNALTKDGAQIRVSYEAPIDCIFSTPGSCLQEFAMYEDGDRLAVVTKEKTLLVWIRGQTGWEQEGTGSLEFVRIPANHRPVWRDALNIDIVDSLNENFCGLKSYRDRPDANVWWKRVS